MPSVVIGKVKGDKGDAGVSPIINLEENESILTISVTDAEGTKSKSINTQENVQSDWNTTDTALDSYIKNKPEIPSKVSQLENDSNYLTDYTETDPTVPAWAKSSTKPEYTAVEVGALSSDTTHLSGDVPITRKINNKTLNADITLTASDIGADSSGSADAALESAKNYTDTKITNLVNGAPTTLDTLKEIADAMEENDSVVTALESSISNKVDKITGKSLSTNDYTTEEKNKLAGIAENANNYTHPTTAGNKHIPSGGKSGQILRWSANGTAVWGSENDTTYSEATQTVSGLLSANDKVKLDGISANANKITVDSALSSTSTNPLQNKVINSELAKKADISHGEHVTFTTTAPKANGTASAGSAATVSRSDHVHPLQTSVTGSSGSCTGNAATATKATSDESGNNIKTSYGASLSVSENNKLTLTSKSGATLSTVDLSNIGGGGSTKTFAQTDEPAVSTTEDTIWLVY